MYKHGLFINCCYKIVHGKQCNIFKVFPVYFSFPHFMATLSVYRNAVLVIWISLAFYVFCTVHCSTSIGKTAFIKQL